MLIASWGWAAEVSVAAPPDRFVAPGEYVTLVFWVSVEAATTVRPALSTTSGWTVVSRLGDVDLAAGSTRPVAVTLAVPAGAPALAVERVTFAVETATARAERVVSLTVAERASLTLEAPSDATLSDARVRDVVGNAGNAAEAAVLELRRGAELVERRELSLGPGERRELDLALDDDGIHTLVLVSERSSEVRRAIGVVRFGAPEPLAHTVVGEASGSIGTGTAWRGTLTLRGPLSDVASLDARLEAASPERSFAAVTLSHAGVRVGGGWRDPHRLDVPSGVGMGGYYEAGKLTFSGAVGRARERLVGGVSAGWRGDGVRLAAGVGWLDDALWLAARAEGEAEASRWSVATSYRSGALTTTLDAELREAAASTRVSVEARDLSSERAVLAASLQVSEASGTMYADGRVALGRDEPVSGRLGVTAAVVSGGQGQLRVGVQAGTAESFVRLSHHASVDGGWRSVAGLGVRSDAMGLGVTVDGTWSYVADDTFGLDARVAYYPSSAQLSGRIGARYQVERDALGASLGAHWDAGDRNGAVSVALGWREHPWRAELTGGATYGAAGASPWSASLTLTAHYAFTLAVPEALVEVMGGRDLGTIAGSVRGDDRALAGVEVAVGRYRVRSDDDGAFTVRVPPGSYQVAVDVSTLPLAYLLDGDARGSVEVRRGEVVPLAIAATRTTVLRGLVLEDRAGDGLPDDPPVGVLARLVVRDTHGVRRSVSTNEAGAFELRGLLPGEVEVAIVDVPTGAVVVGDPRRTLRVEAGVPSDALFLVQPAEVVARAFAPQTLRVRSVALEVDRAPPGAAPLLRVELQGAADSVVAEGPDGVVHPLEFVGDAWRGRVRVPHDQPPGVLALTVRVRSADGEATRRTQLIVDPNASTLRITSDAPVRAGAAVTVEVDAYLAARAIVLSHPFGGDVPMTEEEPGRWVATVSVPEATADAVYTFTLRLEADDGRTLHETLRVRVLGP